MPDYQLGKIYKIVCNTTGLIYVGSTCEPILARRLSGHVRNHKKYMNKKGNYVTSFKILEKNNYVIVLLDNYPCDTKDQLHARERHYIESLECVNKYIPMRTTKEYYDDNQENILINKKIYYTNNKEIIDKKTNEYREKIKKNY